MAKLPLLLLKSGRNLKYVGLTMEKIPVIIVGAGPAGLALALSLAKYEVHVRHFLFGLTVLMMG
jgi:NADPH-dependent 2,4-dienoyl-CoA reductase/sulfur reductase-like enzyme